MRSIIFIFILLSSMYGSNYVFLMEKNLDEKELEAKIISKIGQDALGKEVSVYIPNISETQKKSYNKFCKVVDDCHEADVIFTPSYELIHDICKGQNKIFVSSNYKDLRKYTDIFGVFFWSKGRPNIVIDAKVLKKLNVKLPDSYTQFIE